MIRSSIGVSTGAIGFITCRQNRPKMASKTGICSGELTRVDLRRGIEIMPIPAIDFAYRLDEGNYLPAADRQASIAQIPAERQQVPGQPVAGNVFGIASSIAAL